VSNEPAAVVAPGDVLGGEYRVERVIGGGGMATVVEATALAGGAKVAIKVLLPEMATDAEAVERFLREGRAASRLESEHVIRVLGVHAPPDAAPWMALELLEGGDVRRLLDEHQRLSAREASDIVLQACEGLAEAHAAGIVHRDLKPENLFIAWRNEQPCVKVIDFGVSKVSVPDGADLTSGRMLLGSPYYMAPEQILSARSVDARADVWSLGVILFEMLSGETPFAGRTMADIVLAMAADGVEVDARIPADTPEELVAIVEHCLRKEREERFADVAELATALVPFASPGAGKYALRAAAHLGTASRPPSVVPPSRRSIARASLEAVQRAAKPKPKWALFATALIGVIAGIALAVLASRLFSR
jgi:eukaryotic-like serine/threonine-protein kinase